MNLKQNQTEKQKTKFSLDDFKASAKSVQSEKLLEMISGGTQDDCHVHVPEMPVGDGGGNNMMCH